jgi:hypothetical protein
MFRAGIWHVVAAEEMTLVCQFVFETQASAPEMNNTIRAKKKMGRVSACSNVQQARD